MSISCPPFPPADEKGRWQHLRQACIYIKMSLTGNPAAPTVRRSFYRMLARRELLAIIKPCP